MPDARINVPSAAARGKPFEVRIIIRHAMETGYRTDESGKSIPRTVIRTFLCRYNGEPVFSARRNVLLLYVIAARTRQLHASRMRKVWQAHSSVTEIL